MWKRVSERKGGRYNKWAIGSLFTIRKLAHERKKREAGDGWWCGKRAAAKRVEGRNITYLNIKEKLEEGFGAAASTTQLVGSSFQLGLYGGGMRRVIDEGSSAAAGIEMREKRGGQIGIFLIYIWWGNIIRENFQSGIGSAAEKEPSRHGADQKECSLLLLLLLLLGRKRPVFLNGNKSPGAIRRRARNWAADLLPNTPTSSFFFSFSSPKKIRERNKKKKAGRLLLLLRLLRNSHLVVYAPKTPAATNISTVAIFADGRKTFCFSRNR